MGIAENLAKLSQLSGANQVRFYQDNAKLDALVMERFKDLVTAVEDEDEQGELNSNEGASDDQSQPDKSRTGNGREADQEPGADSPVA